jgi:glycosyltransferase involved in cell wall biosynthesis/SAM-dependent methyltransferase
MSQSSPTIAILIPAYKPQDALTSLARELLSDTDLELIVVDDGGGPEYRHIFDELSTLSRTHILRHAINLGKGAALKTGINYALTTFPGLVGVVTADADGQHDVNDIKRVAQRLACYPDRLVLGVREFTRNVPLRNRFGNTLTRRMVRLLMGKKLSDTQTGLRGIPVALMKDLLKIPSNGYEFELDMLITANHRSIPIEEQPIRTIYDHPNNESHFNPLSDSMKIYFVLLRFGFVSLLTTAIDNLAFFLSFRASASIATAQIIARTFALLFNYNAARSAVFLSREKHALIFPRYLLLVSLNGLISYALINFLVSHSSLSVMWSKVSAETLLFLANFAIQRDFVFTKQRDHDQPTDWTTYYERVPPTAKLARKYTTTVLVWALKSFCRKESPSLVEIGGANSCFLDDILRRIHPAKVDIVDLNEFGLNLLRKRLSPEQPVFLHQQDCRTVSLAEPADAVFSVGLIEHFDPSSTRDATLAHFRLLRPGGVAIITFPTPTWLYRVARGICEMLGLWKFPDERPLTRQEVLSTVQEQGTVLFEKTLWPIVFTQHMIVARKNL